MTTRVIATVIALVLVAAACGGSNAESPSSTTAPTAGSSTDEAPETDDATPGTTTGEQSEASAPSGGSSATLTLDNGEVFKFGILCALESQESAGQEILFTAVSYDKPYNLDITQFGENSFGGAATISIYDAETYDTVWQADATLGAEVTLTLNGSTITGSGTFVEKGEMGGAEAQGELLANC